jgi:hypothetical protein
MLPVTGLPAQTTIQSTPALRPSPTGIMLNDAVEAIATVFPWPLEAPIKIGPAFAPEVAPWPQPAIIRHNATVQVTALIQARSFSFREPCPGRTNLSNIRVNILGIPISFFLRLALLEVLCTLR